MSKIKMIHGPEGLAEMFREIGMGGSGPEDDNDGEVAGRDGKGRKVHPDAIISEFQQAFDRYVEPASKRFKAGDIVTPSSSSDMKGAGSPHIILEVLDQPIQHMDLAKGDDGHREAAGSGFGRRLDVRFLAYYGGRLVPFWGESWQFVPYAE